MRKLGALLVLSVVVASVAHADPADCVGDRYQTQHPVECAFVSSTAVTAVTSLAMTETSSGGTEEKEAYVGQLRDEAAGYIASDGMDVEGPELKAAIEQVHEEYPATLNLTDLQISRVLMKD